MLMVGYFTWTAAEPEVAPVADEPQTVVEGLLYALTGGRSSWQPAICCSRSCLLTGCVYVQ